MRPAMVFGIVTEDAPKVLKCYSNTDFMQSHKSLLKSYGPFIFVIC